MSTSFACINIDGLKSARTGRDPYNFLVGDNFIQPTAVDPLKADYPDLKEPGFFTETDISERVHGAFAKLLQDLKSPEVSKIVSEKLDIDLVDKPKMITIRKISAAKDGRIHTDGKSKLATMLIYFNRAWPAGAAGTVRVLRDEHDFESTVAQVPPLMGNFLGFLRADNSWHGHLPYEGERKVVQITWLESEADVERKKRDNALAQALKGLWPKRKSAA